MGWVGRPGARVGTGRAAHDRGVAKNREAEN